MATKLLYVLCLLASWAAFESFVEEVPAAMIRVDPTLVSAPAFAKARARSEKEGLRGAEILERIIEIVVPNQKGKLDPDGGGRYENQLGLVGLDGDVPRDLALACFYRKPGPADIFPATLLA